MTYPWAYTAGSTAQWAFRPVLFSLWCPIITCNSRAHTDTHTAVATVLSTSRATSEEYTEERGQKACTVQTERVCGSLQSLFSSQTKAFCGGNTTSAAARQLILMFPSPDNEPRAASQTTPSPAIKSLHPALELQSSALQLLTYLIIFFLPQGQMFWFVSQSWSPKWMSKYFLPLFWHLVCPSLASKTWVRKLWHIPA